MRDAKRLTYDDGDVVDGENLRLTRGGIDVGDVDVVYEGNQYPKLAPSV